MSSRVSSLPPRARRAGSSWLLASATALAACALPGCGAPAALSPAEVQAVEARVGAVLDDWHDAAAKADEARYFAHFAKGGVFLGTDATERWDAEAFRAYAHPHFAKGKAWSFRAASRRVVVGPRGEVAWFDEILETKNLGPARGSGVLVRDAATGELRIAHYDLSVTVPNARFKEVKALLEGAGAP